VNRKKQTTSKTRQILQEGVYASQPTGLLRESYEHTIIPERDLRESMVRMISHD
jgi:hypothetical protein